MLLVIPILMLVVFFMRLSGPVHKAGGEASNDNEGPGMPNCSLQCWVGRIEGSLALRCYFIIYLFMPAPILHIRTYHYMPYCWPFRFTQMLHWFMVCGNKLYYDIMWSNVSFVYFWHCIHLHCPGILNYRDGIDKGVCECTFSFWRVISLLSAYELLFTVQLVESYGTGPYFLLTGQLVRSSNTD